MTRIDRQIAFLTEADKLKSVVRATTLADASRFENSAEHSWHLTLYALVLADQAGPDVDINRVIRMLILHDLVEIDAGDNPIFEDTDAAAVAGQEQAAADRLFGLLPEDLAKELRAIWDEFEAAETPSAQFAKALDRFQPPMQNLASGGGSWATYNVDLNRIEARVAPAIKRGAPALWAWLRPHLESWFSSRQR